MRGKLNLIVGARGTGKSTLLKKMLGDLPPERVLLYDLNNEHQEYTARFKSPDGQFTLPDLEVFLDMAEHSRNIVIVCEEATVFFTSYNSSEQIKKILTQLRHTRNGMLLVFHSLRSIPDYMMTFVNNIVLLKTTGDTEDKINRKFDNPDLVRAFNEVSAMPWCTTTDGRRFSPHVIVNVS